MDKIDEIRKLKEHYTKELYSQTRTEQREDQTYYDDTFDVDEVKAPHRVVRSGTGARIVDAPGEQIITANPQAEFEVVKGKKEISLRLGQEVNNWISILRRQNPNIFKESVKNPLLRGETFIKLVHNESWLAGEKVGLPVLFLVTDPMVIYASPAEDINGIPDNVIVFYERQPRDVIVRYPEWTNPKGAGAGRNKDNKVEWFEYWDKDIRYFEADGEPTLKGGIQENVYGFTPFIRRYSGLGRRSPDGELKHLIMSDIRRSRDLIKEECITRSDIASVHHLFSHRPATLILPEGAEVNKDEISELQFGAYVVNVLHLTESPITRLTFEQPELPSTEMYAYLGEIIRRIEMRHPFTVAGFPFGTSGRQQDITQSAAMNAYYTIVENTETAFATAFEKALSICHKIPGLKPNGLNKLDLDAEYKCTVRLKAPDPIEEDRLATLGDRLWSQGNGCIDLRTNLTKYQGYSPEEAEEIITNILVDKVTIFSPEVAQIMGIEGAKALGMEGYLEQLQQQRGMLEEQQAGLQKASPPTTTQRIKGEGVTETEVKPMRGARVPPERYYRR